MLAKYKKTSILRSCLKNSYYYYEDKSTNQRRF